jgi:hypothetical protein
MPLIQQLTKYAFILLCLVIFAQQLITLMDATVDRLVSGGEVSIGPAGIKLGEAPKMPVTKVASVDSKYLADLEMAGSALTRSGSGGAGMSIIQSAVAPTKGMGNISKVNVEDIFYLVHGAAKQRTDYTVKVTLGALDPDLMNKVEKVIYHLHETFDINTREVTDRSTNFALEFTAWGQFEIKADVYLKEKVSPIKLRRWLNF